MNAEELQARFYALVAPSIPNEWDVEEALAPLTSEGNEHLESVFAQVPALWAISHSLCFTYLRSGAQVIKGLAEEERSLWIHALLDRYESGGLHAAQGLLNDAAGQFVRSLRGEGGLSFAAVRPRLQPYINGLLGRDIPLLLGDSPATDGQSIFLPAEVATFAEHQENFLLYKLMVSLQWAALVAGTFNAPENLPLHRKAAHPLECFFSSFALPDKAYCLYHFFETARLLAYLRLQLPGLMRQADPLLSRLPLGCARCDDWDEGRAWERANLLERLQRGLLRGEWPLIGTEADKLARELLQRSETGQDGNQLSLQAVEALMPLVHHEELGEPLSFQGILRLQEMRNLGMKEQSDRELRLMRTMRLRLQQATATAPPAERQPAQASGQQGQDLALHVLQEGSGASNPPLDTDLRLLLPPDAPDTQQEEAIQQDAGQSSSAQQEGLSSTAGPGGQGKVSAARHAPVETDTDAASSLPLVYDEWDFRRKGFRKNWCVLTERPLKAVQTSFVEQTLNRHRGQIRRLRHQFALMQTGERFIRRQREGNDIDLDALIESLSDSRAGLAPSERLFIRLSRSYRDIATYFLVDMSNSTAGWIGRTIKESLLLLCEAMEKLGDRYAIYGFSGMRRLRCEVYPVKKLNEPYSAEIRNRIAAIGPKEYTRMAPAIRHVSGELAKVEAKIRLLILLSDGKPEDYDDYKGQYAIEDTRHALMEARLKGIHPFALTIDREAREYTEHMYGAGSFLLVDEVSKLPARMPAIYRVLTT